MFPKDSGSVLKVYYAQVKKNDKDEQVKANKVQVNISPYTDGWDEDHLPWCFPFSMHLGSTENSAINTIPVIDSMVYVTKIFNKWYYIADARVGDEKNLAEYFFDNVKDELGELEIIDGPDSEYPNVVSFIYENGFCISYDTTDDNPYFSFYHPEGTYIVIDKDGSIGGYSAKNIELKNADGVQVKIEEKNIFVTDGNDTENTITMDDQQFQLKNGDNKIVSNIDGITITDKNSNKWELKNTGTKLTDMNNNIVETTTTSIKLNNNLEIFQ